MRPRIKRFSVSLSENRLLFHWVPLTFWHFIIEAGPLQPNRQSGQAASDSLTVCLNSGRRLCFHSATRTPSAKGAQLPRLYLRLDLPSMSGVYALVLSARLCAARVRLVSVHTHEPQINGGRQASLCVRKWDWHEKESEQLFDLALGAAMRALTLLHTLNSGGAWSKQWLWEQTEESG